jgi:hypothetical protein
MSDGELTRLEALRDLDQKRWLLELGRCQVFRGLKAYRTEGPSGLISKRRGRRSNRRKSEALRRAAVAIIRQWYRDFGPTLAVEKLREDHGIALGSRDGAAVDDRGWAVARSPAAAQSHPPAAARMRWRAVSGRRLRALVVRGSRCWAALPSRFRCCWDSSTYYRWIVGDALLSALGLVTTATAG